VQAIGSQAEERQAEGVGDLGLDAETAQVVPVIIWFTIGSGRDGVEGSGLGFEVKAHPGRDAGRTETDR
jgi:hypothetical protein